MYIKKIYYVDIDTDRYKDVTVDSHRVNFQPYLGSLAVKMFQTGYSNQHLLYKMQVLGKRGAKSFKILNILLHTGFRIHLLNCPGPPLPCWADNPPKTLNDHTSSTVIQSLQRIYPPTTKTFVSGY